MVYTLILIVVGIFWFYVKKALTMITDQLQISARASRVESLLNDSLLVFGSLAILLMPLAFALAKPGPGGEAWTVLTFVCCSFAAWFFFFDSSLQVPLLSWLLAWACAMAGRVNFNRHRA
jgi:hypothetical protein